MDFKKLFEKHEGSLKFFGVLIIVVFCALYIFNNFVISPFPLAPSQGYSGYKQAGGNFAPQGGAQFVSSPSNAMLMGGAAYSSSNYKKLETTQQDDTSSTDRKLIKTASMNVEVEFVNESLQKVSSIAKTYGGYISDSNDWTQRGSISIKIPNSKFDEILKDLRQIGKVESESSNSRDVTEQYVDLQARLNSAKAQETRYLEILNKANTVEEILLVEKELSRTRSNIESMQGQMNYLANQIDFSKISINLHTPQEPIKPIYDLSIDIFGMLYAAYKAFVSSLSGLIVFFGGVFPWVIVAGGAWLVWKKFVVKNKK